jgi:transcription elongation factor GreA
LLTRSGDDILVVRHVDGAPSIEKGVSSVTEMLLTPKGFQKLNAQHARLRVERERHVERIRRALEFGRALPENGEYLNAKHELELLDHRLARLEDRLRGAEVVDPVRDGEVDVGEHVTVLDLESGETIDFRIVGAGESDPKAGEVSYESPIGAALRGRRVGDVVEADAPAGPRRLEILRLDG